MLDRHDGHPIRDCQPDRHNESSAIIGFPSLSVSSSKCIVRCLLASQLLMHIDYAAGYCGGGTQFAALLGTRGTLKAINMEYW